METQKDLNLHSIKLFKVATILSSGINGNPEVFRSLGLLQSSLLFLVVELMETPETARRTGSTPQFQSLLFLVVELMETTTSTTTVDVEVLSLLFLVVELMETRHARRVGRKAAGVATILSSGINGNPTASAVDFKTS